MLDFRNIGSIGKRFVNINLENNAENRRKYRQMLFTTPGLNEFISGVIMFEETFKQKTDDGISFVQFLERQSIVPGIKLDTGVVPLSGTINENTTQGKSFPDIKKCVRLRKNVSF